MPLVAVKHTLHVHDYTDEEIASCFYCVDEYRSFKFDATRTARMIAMKQAIDEEYFTARGIEHAILAARRTLPGGVKARATPTKHEIRQKAIHVVMEEQIRQFILCCEEDDRDARFCCDDSSIASVYKAARNESVTSARMKGLSDEAVALASDKVQKHEAKDGESLVSSILSPLPRTIRLPKQKFTAAA